MFTKKAVNQAVISAIAVRHITVGQVRSEQEAGNTSEVQSKYLQNTFISIPLAAAYFNELPDCAHVRQPTVLALFACSPASLWRWVKSGRLPAPKKLGLRVSAWNVGELRTCLNGLQSSDQGSVKVRGE